MKRFQHRAASIAGTSVSAIGRCQFLGMLDELELLDGIFCENPISRPRPWGPRDKAAPFIVADGFDVHPAPFRGFGCAQSFHVPSIGPYCSTECKRRRVRPSNAIL